MKTVASLSTVALALIVGMAGATAQTRAKKTARADTPEARLKMCDNMYKGQYQSPQQGVVFQHGYCLSNVRGWAGAPQEPAPGPRAGYYYYGAPSYYYGGTGSYGAYAGQPVGGGGGQAYAGGGYLGPAGYYPAR